MPMPLGRCMVAFALTSTGLCTVAALPPAPASLAPQAANFVLTPPGEAVTSWPAKLQPFFLSALSNKLTPAEASYIGRFPLAVINHKQGGDKGQAEQKQISAITAIKAANDSCAAFFYLNSQIDFPELALHTEAKADGTWWLRNSDGSYAWHNGTEERRGDGDHIFDWTVPAARIAWLKTASAALAHPAVAGVFVDKAGGGCPAKGVAPKHATAWARAHDKMLDKLVASTDKNIILNNAYRLSAEGTANQSGAGQLFERWGESPDHDGLNLTQDMALLQRLHGNGQITLARAGGVRPGSGDKPDPKLCASGLAAFLVASAAPGLGFFSCQVDFASTATSGWMTELSDPVYSKQLGAPSGAAVASGGVASRRFSGGAVAIVKSATGEGCVTWADGSVSGQCPQL